MSRDTFEYAVLRVVPRVERGEALNAGVVLYCRTRGYLAARTELDERALAALSPGCDPTGVRAQLDLVERVAAAVRSGHGAVVPVLPVVDTIKEVGPGEVVIGTVDRSVLRSVQTPQAFRRDVLVAAHAAAGDALTDDAGLVEKAGVAVTCVPGSELAMKITRPLDLILAEALLLHGDQSGP
jgi:hypothetical protein